MITLGDVILEIDGYVTHLDTTNPLIEIVTELLVAAWCRPELFEHFSVTRAAEGHGSTGHGGYEYPDCHAPPGSVCFANAVVKVTDGQRNWIYKVGEYDMCKDAWKARWPD